MSVARTTPLPAPGRAPLHRGAALERLVVEQLHYSRLSDESGQWAVLRLLARLAAEPAAAPSAHLVVQTGPSCAGLAYAAAQHCRLERRLLSRDSEAFESLWSAAFSLPLGAVESPQAVFKLIGGNGRVVAHRLPIPCLRDVTLVPLELAQLRGAHRAAPRRRALIGARQAAALATTVAVTATSVPTAALAASGGGAGTPPAASASATAASRVTVAATGAASSPGAELTIQSPQRSTGNTRRPAHHSAHRSSSTGGASLIAPRGTSATAAPLSSAPRSSTGGRSSSSSGSSTPSSSTGTASGLSHAPTFTAPRSWTGSVAPNPALTGAVTELSGLLSNGDRPPSFLIPIYMEAGRRYHVPWEVLAAINAVETDYGQNLNTSSAGAVGWMQFEPSTWRQYGMAVDGHSVPNPYDPRDAIFSAARYLAAAGAARDVSRAVYAYNHASWYVNEVMSRARAIAGHAQYERETVRRGVFSVSFATGHSTAPTVRYTGGVLSHFDRLIAAANMVSAANFPYVWGGGHQQPSRFGPFDCSGSVSYAMQQAGYQVPTTVSGDIGSWGFPAGPGQVTIFYNPTHTFMRIGNRYFGTSGFARPGGGAGWFDVDKLPAGYLAGFREVHVPDLGPDSFSQSQPVVPAAPPSTPHPHHSSTSTVRFWPVMSTLGAFPAAG